MKKLFSKWVRLVVLMSITMIMTSCGSLTGIPGHGGGKRFAVEQELVAATVRASLKQLDLKVLQGKKVNIFINAIGDTGVGNLLGGRFSLVSQLRGNYIQAPPVVEKSIFPRYTSTTSSNSTSTTSTDSISTTSINSNSSTEDGSNTSVTSNSGTSTTDSLLAMPEKTSTTQEGRGIDAQVGIEYKGLGAYQNSDRVSSDDLQYLFGLVQTYFFLQNINIVPPSEAEVDVYVIVDVYGTIRTRVDWFIANNEILRAKTSMEVMAVDHARGTLVLKPQSVVAEAEYNEQYVLWMGPVSIKKFLQESEPLLCDFTDLTIREGKPDYPAQDGQLAYPFRYQIKQWLAE